MIMNIDDFIQHFAEQFEETNADVFTPEMVFRDNDEWSSLIAMSVMAMVDEEYDVQLSANEMRQANTVKDLYDIVISHL